MPTLAEPALTLGAPKAASKEARAALTAALHTRGKHPRVSTSDKSKGRRAPKASIPVEAALAELAALGQESGIGY
jgi:hypothetical protein